MNIYKSGIWMLICGYKRVRSAKHLTCKCSLKDEHQLYGLDMYYISSNLSNLNVQKEGHPHVPWLYVFDETLLSLCAWMKLPIFGSQLAM